MTAITASTEDLKHTSATQTDSIETQKKKPSIELKKEANTSNVTTNESVEINEISKIASGQSASANTLTTGDGSAVSIRQNQGVTAGRKNDGPMLSSALSIMNANKKSRKKIDRSNIIETPNVHDVLLGRGKPVSKHVHYRCHY